MRDLDTRIRVLVGSLLDAAPEPPEFPEPDRADASAGVIGDAIPDRPAAPLVTPTGPARRPWRVAVPAMLVTLALIGGAVLLIQSEAPSDGAAGGTPAPASAPPHVLIPIDEALAASAPFERVADSYRDAYASGDSAAVLSLLDTMASRLDATFPSVLPTKRAIGSVLFPEPSFDPDCGYAQRFAGGGEGLYIAECSERFGYGFPPDAPLVEVSHWTVTTRGLVSGWTLHYGLDSLGRLPDEFWDWDRVSDDVAAADALLADYGAAWSSGDVGRVASLYLPQARRGDSLLGDTRFGPEAIAAYAAELAAWYPDASWMLVGGFSNTDGIIGGVYAITTPGLDGGRCEVRVATRLEVVDGFIEREAVFYDVESLAACGWAA